jgi:hypothetical protein
MMYKLLIILIYDFQDYDELLIILMLKVDQLITKQKTNFIFKSISKRLFFLSDETLLNSSLINEKKNQT